MLDVASSLSPVNAGEAADKDDLLKSTHELYELRHGLYFCTAHHILVLCSKNKIWFML